MKNLLILVGLALLVLVLLAARPLLRGTGQVAVDTEGMELLLYGPWGLRTTIGPGTEPKTVRAAVYRPAQLSRTHKRQVVTNDKATVTELWQMQSNGPWGRLSSVEVQKDQTAIIEFSSPPAIKIGTQIGAGQAFFALQIVGPYGEHYSPLIRRNGHTVGKPKIRIINDREQEMYTGNFEFG